MEFSRIPPEELARNRRNGCFPRSAVLGNNEAGIARRVAERSSYFRLRSWIRIGTAEFALYSLLYRDGSGQVRPILRTMGTD